MEVSGKKRLLCDPCKGEHDDEPAVSYCTVCNEYLCHGCRKAHTRAKATKNHLLMDRDAMPKHKPTSDKDSMCPKHSDKHLKYYCKTHDHFCCSVCATIGHKQCNVQYIDDIAIDFHKSNEYVALEKSTANLIKRLQETKNTAISNIKDLATKHANFISDLQQFRKEINNKLDALQDEATKEVQIAMDIDKNTVENIATKCDSMLSEIHSLSSKLVELNKYKQDRQLMICSKKTADTVNTYTKRVNGLSEQNHVNEYKFEPNEKIRKFLHSLDSLCVAKEMQDGGETDSQTTYPDVSSQTFHQPTASYVGSIDVRHSTDKKLCFIKGGVLIDETRLAFIDHNNFSVKIADVDNNTLLSCTKLPTQPWGITCVNRTQIAVTCSDHSKGKLVFLNIDKSLTVLKEFSIGKNCRGIVYSNDTFYVTFQYPESPVKMIDMNGKILKTFKTNKAGGALFSDPDYISLSTDQQTVFVSDVFNHIVTSLTLDDGTVQHVYTADSLKGRRGLAVDKNDNVYIAGCWSDNIHQLSTEGNLSQVILDETHGVEGPCMVTYCKTRHRLYISVQKDGRHEVSVYQLHT